MPAQRIVRAELGVLAIPRQRTTVAPGAGAELWLATAVVRGCLAPPLGGESTGLGRLRPMACAGAAIGAIGGQGRGDALASTRARQLWISAAVAAGLGVAIVRRFGVFARIEGHVHARRPGFHLDAVGSVHRVGESSVTAFLGLQVVLP